MSFFRKKQGPVERRLHELDKELRRLETQISRLQRSPGRAAGTFKPAATALPPGRRAPAPEPPPPPPPAPEPAREDDLWSRPDTEPPSRRPGNNEVGQRWWRSLFGQRPAPADPRLVSYLSTGSFKTVRPLRYERRVARNKFLVSLAVLAGAIGLLMLALKNC